MLVEDTGINFKLVTYMRVHEALQFFIDSRRNIEPAPEQSLKFYLRTFVKGSGPYRRTIELASVSKEKLENNTCVRTFYSFVGIPVSEEPILKSCWSAWNKTYFGNRHREFLFKFYNNILGVNARVAHFVAGHSADCSVCLFNDEPAPRQAESFLHVFYDCHFTSKYRCMVEQEFFPEIDNRNENEKKIFWLLGLIPFNNEWVCNQFVHSAVFSFNFLIWKIKLSKNLIPVSIFRVTSCTCVNVC
jgi:hypothetical protein